jgi:hypothetical protein
MSLNTFCNALRWPSSIAWSRRVAMSPVMSVDADCGELGSIARWPRRPKAPTSTAEARGSAAG